MRRALSLLLGLACALGLALALPAAASAHDVLQATDPGDGATVATLPASVNLTFSEPPLAMGTQVIVTGPAGTVSEGVTSIDGGVVRQAISATAPGGDYTVTYRVTADDGHPVTGSFAFYAAHGRDGSPARRGPTPRAEPASAQDTGSSALFVPIMLTIVGATMLLAITGFIVLRTRTDDED
ncbi:MAG: copper resistance CopC family protein [Terracoccus sp.]